jgi:hypothetical protein
MDRTCTKCGRVFTTKHALVYHISNKVCQKSNSRICDICGVQFSSKQRRITHQQANICTKPDNPVAIGLLDEISELKRQNTELIGQIAELKSKQVIPSLPKPVTPFALPIFTYDQIMTRMPKLIGIGVNRCAKHAVFYLLINTVLNPKVPIFNFVKITNKTGYYMSISDGTAFRAKSKRVVINDLISQSVGIILEYLDNFGDQHDQCAVTKCTTYLDDIDQINSSKHRELFTIIRDYIVEISPQFGTEEWCQLFHEKYGNSSDAIIETVPVIYPSSVS